MALDRQTIEKRDFPIGPRGYDREAVDAHLAAVADEVDELKRSARRVSEAIAELLQRLNAEPETEPRTAPKPETADIDGARLVALNMVLNGTPRDETDRYLSENFQLEDRVTLLDEVYSSVQG